MKSDFFKMALSNLLHRKTRSWLTLIGIFIGITAVVALVSLGQGLQYALTAEFLEMGADKMQVSVRTPFGLTDASLDNSLRDSDRRVIEQTPGVLQTAVWLLKSGKMEWGDEIGFYPIIGQSTKEKEAKLLQDYMTMELAQGRQLRPGDNTKAIVGYELTNPDKLEVPMKVGDKVVVNGTTFEIIGRWEKMGDPVVDSALFISEDAFNDMFGSEDKYDGLIVQTQPGEDPEIVAERITQELRRERGLDEGDEDFDVQTPKELVDSFNTVFNIVQFVLIGIAAISLLIGGIGIMNTMYTAVLERTKEIGIMKAIGATNGTIMTLFLIESGFLGLLGGMIGLLTGIGLAKATQYVGRAVLNTDLLYALVPWWLIVGSLAFACITGILSGVLPAYRASRQKPVDSLRYE
jgi:putative ABC transport system permease protein